MKKIKDINYIEKKEKEYLTKLYIDSLYINDLKKELDSLIKESISFNSLKEIINKRKIDLSSFYLSSFLRNKEKLKNYEDTTIKLIARPFFIMNLLMIFLPIELNFLMIIVQKIKNLLEDLSSSIRFIFLDSIRLIFKSFKNKTYSLTKEIYDYFYYSFDYEINYLCINDGDINEDDYEEITFKELLDLLIDEFDSFKGSNGKLLIKKEYNNYPSFIENEIYLKEDNYYSEVIDKLSLEEWKNFKKMINQDKIDNMNQRFKKIKFIQTILKP